RICASPVRRAAGALAVAAAVAGHLVWLAAMVRSRKRPALDWGLRFVLTGAGALALATLLGLGLAFDLTGGPRVALAYAALALGAWLSLTIAGMLLKIVPFLVWYQVYAPRAGRAAVPTLADLSSPRAEALAWLLLTLGTMSLSAALWYGGPAWIRATGVTVAAGAVVFGATLARVLGHFRRRTPSVSRATAPLVRPA